jgi:hypothetical protein
MRQVEEDLIPLEGLAVLTCQRIDFRAPLFIADFRDQQILIFTPTGNPIGISIDRGMRLGRRPLQMRNGIWVMEEEEKIPEQYQDKELRAEDVAFSTI